jgi:hypothetical protein
MHNHELRSVTFNKYRKDDQTKKNVIDRASNTNGEKRSAFKV